MAGKLKQAPPREEDGLMTKERIRAIQEAKGSCSLSSSFILKFDAEWSIAVGRLKRAGFRR